MLKAFTWGKKGRSYFTYFYTCVSVACKECFTSVFSFSDVQNHNFWRAEDISLHPTRCPYLFARERVETADV